MLTQVLTRIGPPAAFAAAVLLLAQVENPYWTAACLAVFAAQLPIQRAILAWDARSRAVRVRAPVARPAMGHYG
jgi:hypothetical protein